LRFDRDVKSQAYRTDFSIVARIVDSAGAVVRKSSQPYRLSGPLSQTDQAQRGEILFFRQPALGPGRYTLEVAVHDALAMRSGVRRSPFVVPESTVSSLQVSTLVLVARGERGTPGESVKNNPLSVGDVLIYPNLGEPINTSKVKAVTFFVVVTAGSSAAPQAMVEILRDGQAVAHGPTVLASADATGEIRHLAQASVDTLDPGRYTLRLTIVRASDAKYGTSSLN
jgi:hypothetical protein